MPFAIFEKIPFCLRGVVWRNGWKLLTGIELITLIEKTLNLVVNFS